MPSPRCPQLARQGSNLRLAVVNSHRLFQLSYGRAEDTQKNFWQAWRDSNSQSHGFGDRCCTIEPHAYMMNSRFLQISIVLGPGLEPGTFDLRDRYSNQLS